jgi:hydroxyacylglutathione hydrolase
MVLETVVVGAMQVNCYILASKEGSSAIIIDPGDQKRKIQRCLEEHRLKPAFIINTHGHYDHIGANDDFGVPVYAHRQDALMLKDPQANLSGVFSLPYGVKSPIKILDDFDTIDLEDIRLQVLHIPGHTLGGVALRMLKPQTGIVFTGDSLFFNSIGRSDLADGDEELLKNGIREKLLTLPDDTIVYPGHGPSTTIGEEKKNNPFL